MVNNSLQKSKTATKRADIWDGGQGLCNSNSTSE